MRQPYSGNAWADMIDRLREAEDEDENGMTDQEREEMLEGFYADQECDLRREARAEREEEAEYRKERK